MMTGGYGVGNSETILRLRALAQQILPWYQMGVSLVGFTRCGWATRNVTCCAATGALMMALGKVLTIGYGRLRFIGSTYYGAVLGTASAIGGATGEMCASK